MVVKAVVAKGEHQAVVLLTNVGKLLVRFDQANAKCLPDVPSDPTEHRKQRGMCVY